MPSFIFRAVTRAMSAVARRALKVAEIVIIAHQARSSAPLLARERSGIVRAHQYENPSARACNSPVAVVIALAAW